MELPKKGYRVEFETLDADFILFLQDFSVSRKSEYDFEGDYMGEYLIYETNFCYLG